MPRSPPRSPSTPCASADGEASYLLDQGAGRRLDEIGPRIEIDNPAAAARVIRTIALGFHRLGASPGRGRPGRIRGTRELVIVGTPYIVAYRVHANDVEVLTIQHGAQLWPDSL